MTRSPLIAPKTASVIPSLPLCRYLTTGLARFGRASNGLSRGGVCVAATYRGMGNQTEAAGPRGISGQPIRPGSDDRQANVDIAARGIGVGAYLVGLRDQRFGLGAGEARQRDGEVDVETEAAFRARADADGRGDGGVGRNLRAALRGHELHRAD